MEDNNIASFLKPSAEAGFNDDKYSSLNSCRSETTASEAAVGVLCVSHTGAQTVNFATLDVITM